jgi:hypothetical protein
MKPVLATNAVSVGREKTRAMLVVLSATASVVERRCPI